jgi:tol-pal system protein YbgF
VAVLIFLSGCVESQSFAVLENRVAAIEMENNRQLTRKNAESKELAIQNEQQQLMLKQDFEALEKRLDEGHSMSRDEYAELKYDIQSFKEDLQRLEGLIGEVNHRFQTSSQQEKEAFDKQLERLDMAISKNYERLIRLEKYMGFEPSVGGEIAKDLVASEEPAKDTEQEAYDFAKRLFDDGDNANARIQFENFINKFPDSPNADNARFWIADSYYAEKWFEKAILEYQKVLEGYPDSNKLAAARLKQGYAFAELGEKANARLILKELIKKHPKSNEAKYAQEKLKSLN